ncbi:MAG: hypothetical protein A3G52_03080 [Candidatus Taylorbacteria bacterium RIFCSPLOWO2_12_FULL_43_20]|uniref:HTH arsR-type domain-containing protein n=1 Tax=Candidatus Taylorbacteria bacterium RIFCSPLOWO2_12_FULL_43_20 TaxID=1802332 RepID=A0A1G2P3A5_9BACT|nr:MAG: hypothetical protein A2825_03765 [Candidatus Taylorbacteria bacterium RIFCSPHIGHO2_01_FULL_43_120]OHA22064.1 MAG: hypothetical protein A3B98_04150 [Candidatus Taylorbacteria bacterium RIFCSPHIGHO2_02_FULL_43_55]OHA30357.1 MAG: hypothetical protein A3E92_00625 [Candidatus Taylorbacteria bacterium RIFCSPHIGHO2_12_FULL_42_34]OHA31037.1 MAG: hypothetical protein A3B09_04095 [Candidatus Taylorbacteria bacterium RIFCSPLOWO2_01_FULL_43_83]OHA39727.1 MAG: hypothetical protein A3H58_04705 [Candi
MNDLEKSIKALANRRRLAIARLLKKSSDLTVGELAENIKLSFKSTSRHLSVLYAAEIIGRDQKGLEMHYYLHKIQKPGAKEIISIL